jgi:hypothetical protein
MIISSAITNPPTDDFNKICTFPNLLLAWRKAAKGKRGGCAAAGFEYGLADRLLQIQEELLTEEYRPGSYSGPTVICIPWISSSSGN